MTEASSAGMTEDRTESYRQRREARDSDAAHPIWKSLRQSLIDGYFALVLD
jgi:hypothetical protein